MIKRIVFDGNDGTGKTTRLNRMREIFPNLEYADRGIFSETTLVDGLFASRAGVIVGQTSETERLRREFYDKIKSDTSTLYIICRASPHVCQERILLRGDSIEEEFHTMDDLVKYNDRFDVLIDIVRDLPNVMVVNTD